MQLYLITHAHTEQNPSVAADAWRLSARGVEQAARLAEAPFWHHVDRVVVSAEPKTWLTVADVVAQRGLPVWIDSRFDELRRTDWIEDYAAQVAKVFAHAAEKVMGWEAADHVRQRVNTGLADLQVRFAGETLALVGHGLCLSLLRADLLGLAQVDFSAWQRLAFGSHALASLKPRGMLEDFSFSEERIR
jgi:broad specificity phosphatase PhoE